MNEVINICDDDNEQVNPCVVHLDVSKDDEIIDVDNLSEEERKNLNWKKNCPYIYNYILTQSLEWPSLTCEWLPGRESVSGGTYTEQRLLLGTHTSEGEQNALILTKVRLPNPEVEVEKEKCIDDNGQIIETGGYGYKGVNGKIEIVVKMYHTGEVNRARHMSQNPLIIATKSPNGETYIYNIARHPAKPKDFLPRPEIILRGHNQEGYGLSWNPLQHGLLLSGSNDSKICLWDVTDKTSGITKTCDPMITFLGHDDVVEDVSWHPSHKSLFGSVGDDKKLLIWDTRKPYNEPILKVNNAHEGNINSLAFNGQNEYLLATGSSDKVVSLWDLRVLSKPLYNLNSHTDEVFHVKWSPFNSEILASGGCDNKIHIWDLSQINSTQNNSELLFVHGGHKNTISDLSWNCDSNWTMASVSSENMLQIWQPSDKIVNKNIIN